MSQNKSVESPNNSLLNQSIHPVLQSALGSLDLELEEELMRYRRQKAGRPVKRPSGLGRHQLRKPLELISLDQGEKIEPSAREMNADNQLLFPLVLIDKTNEETPSQAQQPETNQTNNLTPVNTTADQAAKEESEAEPFNPPEPSSEVESGLVNPPADEAPPDDYLESSERLLESLAEEEKGGDVPEPFAHKLLTPLGIGSMLLLLVLCASVPYILINPSIMAALGLDRFLGLDKSVPEASPAQTRVANVDSARNPSQLSGPNLAQKEFGNVNLNTLPMLETSPTPTPTDLSEPLLPDLPDPGANETLSNQGTSSTSSLSGGSSNLSSVLLPPLPPPPTFEPRIEEPASNSASSAPAESQPTSTSRQFKQSTSSVDSSGRENTETASSSAPKGGYYFVLVNYTDESSLEKARQIVPDAYIRKLPQGTRIQMGALKQEAEAKQLVEQLQQQGISASISRE
ncbi:MAG: SPOR domain-containing protein [Coleofasciculaceae cyanobacterium]